MGSTMKRSIFDEQTSKALTKWRNNAKKKTDHAKPQIQTQTLGGGSSSSPAAPQKDASQDQVATATATVDIPPKEAA